MWSRGVTSFTAQWHDRRTHGGLATSPHSSHSSTMRAANRVSWRDLVHRRVAPFGGADGVSRRDPLHRSVVTGKWSHGRPGGASPGQPEGGATIYSGARNPAPRGYQPGRQMVHGKAPKTGASSQGWRARKPAAMCLPTDASSALRAFPISVPL